MGAPERASHSRDREVDVSSSAEGRRKAADVIRGRSGRRKPARVKDVPQEMPTFLDSGFPESLISCPPVSSGPCFVSFCALCFLVDGHAYSGCRYRIANSLNMFDSTWMIVLVARLLPIGSLDHNLRCLMLFKSLLRADSHIT